MSMNAVKYTTQQGDTWPAIAHRAYGEFHRWTEIAAANPKLPLSATLAAGTIVWVPVVEAIVSTSTQIGQPPWK